jgi:hypothetical protein
LVQSIPTAVGRGTGSNFFTTGRSNPVSPTT